MPSGKRRVHSDSGRHDDDRWRNTSGVFRKASETFFKFPTFTDLYRLLTEIAEVHYTPVTLKIYKHVTVVFFCGVRRRLSYECGIFCREFTWMLRWFDFPVKGFLKLCWMENTNMINSLIQYKEYSSLSWPLNSHFEIKSPIFEKRKFQNKKIKCVWNCELFSKQQLDATGIRNKKKKMYLIQFNMN